MKPVVSIVLSAIMWASSLFSRCWFLTPWLIALIILLSGCTTYRSCVRKFGQTLARDSVSIPVTVSIPRDSVVLSFMTDTIPVYDTIRKESPNGRAIIKIVKDTSGRVTAICDCKDSIVTVTAKCPPVLHLEDPPDYWRIIALALGIVAAVLSIIITRRK